MSERKDSYCGLYCGACELFMATRNNTLTELAAQRNLNPEELRCNGCKSSICSTYCTNCVLKKCARSKNREFCFQCIEFPCHRIISFQSDGNEHKLIILQNLESIKRSGLSLWLVNQSEAWSCRSCGAQLTYYKKICDCGIPLLHDCSTANK